MDSDPCCKFQLPSFAGRRDYYDPRCHRDGYLAFWHSWIYRVLTSLRSWKESGTYSPFTVLGRPARE